jgi:hypothetical protein
MSPTSHSDDRKACERREKRIGMASHTCHTGVPQHQCTVKHWQSLEPRAGSKDQYLEASLRLNQGHHYQIFLIVTWWGEFDFLIQFRDPSLPFNHSLLSASLPIPHRWALQKPHHHHNTLLCTLTLPLAKRLTLKVKILYIFQAVAFWTSLIRKVASHPDGSETTIWTTSKGGVRSLVSPGAILDTSVRKTKQQSVENWGGVEGLKKCVSRNRRAEKKSGKDDDKQLC